MMTNKQEITDLIGKNKLVDALEKMKNYIDQMTTLKDVKKSNTIIALKGQITRLNQAKQNRLISFSEAGIEENRIVESMLEVLNEL